MLKIYGRTTSFNVQKVMWLVAELGLPHTRIDVGGKYGALHTPDFLAMNPNGKIPVIDDDGLIVWESNAIVRYLAAKHGMGSWCPADAGQRAHADQWMTWASGELYAGVIGLFVNYFRTKDANRDWALIRSCQQKCVTELTLLDRILAVHPHLSGEYLTMGDIPAAAKLYRYFTMDLERPKLPNLESWYQRLAQIPAYRTHVMVPYEELKGTL
jgi:glutathione S-transferase